jgi:hypothetical protein
MTRISPPFHRPIKCCAFIEEMYYCYAGIVVVAAIIIKLVGRGTTLYSMDPKFSKNNK